jgi:hypothetical protein
MERDEDGTAVAVPEDPAAFGRADGAGAADRELRTGRAAVDALAERLDRRPARVVRRRVRGRALPGAQPSGDPS